MSNLKHLSLEDLKKAETECIEGINYFSSRISGQQERLKWIQKYIKDKSVKKMTVAELEAIVGHKLEIVAEGTDGDYH